MVNIAINTVNDNEYERVLERYLDICNQAIEKNKDTFPYNEIWKARWKDLGTLSTAE
jgi:NADH:ubiquinone oxidoreductase subunit D